MVKRTTYHIASPLAHQPLNPHTTMTRYYLIKEVDGKVVRKTEIVHAEPRDSRGRYVSPDERKRLTLAKVRQAHRIRCPRCGHEFLAVM